MNKRILYLIFAVFFLSINISCSSDDDDNFEETAHLVGNWQLSKVEFSNAISGGFPLEDQCMTTLILGYQFKANNDLAIVIAAGFPSGQDLWTWEGNENGFEIVQNNHQYPPYNFGLNAEDLNFEKINDQWVMTFHSDLGHGSKAKFTLIKQNIDENLRPLILNPDGSEYTCDYGNAN